MRHALDKNRLRKFTKYVLNLKIKYITLKEHIQLNVDEFCQNNNQLFFM